MNKAIAALLVLISVTASSHGQTTYRKQVARAITAMEKDENQIVKLVNLTGRDFGLNSTLWKIWLNGISNDELTRTMERRCRAEEIDREWHQFAKAYANVSIARFRHDDAQQRLAEIELKRTTEKSKEYAAWLTFADGCTTLQASCNSGKAAAHFRGVCQKMPLSAYADASDEIAFLLEMMAHEDNSWVEPNDLSNLSRQQESWYYVYHLRHVHVDQDSQPSRCHVLHSRHWPEFVVDSNGEFRVLPNEQANAAVELKKMGKDAIPVLLELLDDRRPIRSIGHWRLFWPEQAVLRYQDVASQLLDELLPIPFFSECKTSYLSTEAPQARYELIARVRKWQRLCNGKSEAEQLWLGLKMKVGIDLQVMLLKRLAMEYNQCEDVLAELHAMYNNMHPVYRPYLTEVMVELRDCMKVGEVLQMLERDELQQLSLVDLPDAPPQC